MNAMTVGQLATTIGVSADTVRFWEREGLLPAPRRSSAGYRLYQEDSIDRLRFIRTCQRLGLTLADIAQLLQVRDTGRCPCESAEGLLARRLAEVEDEIRRLQVP
ncbi:MerR family transcriptional regulator [Natronoglycomyces albus]|uniref:MerR family transcriptional regulator n=1 Tax=Natronoglycomyces albus TaxID=2811108 RepID=A0A895XP12_9ACTN|nr:MerR family transcriptional regulator [Natronoglycomyces albus]QSB04030.1 MerR family transcriptional regulator [Natronoglycomyces albus]